MKMTFISNATLDAYLVNLLMVALCRHSKVRSADRTKIPHIDTLFFFPFASLCFKADTGH